MEKQEAVNLNNVSNGAKSFIEQTMPYVVHVSIQGTVPLLFNKWNTEAIAEKAKAKKGSIEKKTDDPETKVYRDDDGNICLPGIYLIRSITDKKNGAAKYLQDPRSPRKSALDLYKAGLIPLTLLASLGTKTWDYLDSQRVVVQQSGITRIRPAMKAGWRADFDLQVLTPEYIAPSSLLECLVQAGRLVGLGDFRPSYGRFSVTSFKIQED